MNNYIPSWEPHILKVLNDNPLFVFSGTDMHRELNRNGYKCTYPDVLKFLKWMHGDNKIAYNHSTCGVAHSYCSLARANLLVQVASGKFRGDRLSVAA